MSKKILKRSLALGALMAFVITGSAMAASITETIESGYTWTKFPSDGQAKGYEEVVLTNNNGAVFYVRPVTIEASKKVELNSNGEHAIYYSSCDISAPTISIIAKGTSADGIYVASDDKTSKVCIHNFDKLTVESEKVYAIFNNAPASNPNVLTIDGNENSEVILKSENSWSLVNWGAGNTTINTGTLKVTSNSAQSGNIVLYSASTGKMEINVDNLYVANTNENNSDYRALYVVDGETEINITGEAVIDGLAEVYSGVLNFNATGTNASYTGMVSTNVGKANFNFSNGATWNLTEASSLTNATFNAGSTFVIDGATYEASKGVYALNGVGENAKLTVEEGAKLKINGITETTYNIAKDFTNLEGAVDKWEVSDINALMQGVAWTTKDGLQVTVTAKEADKMAADTGMSTSTASLVQSIIENKDNASTPAQEAAVGFIEKAQANNATPEAVGNAINNATKMGEAGGNSATAASIVKNVTGVTNDRLSFNCGHSAPHKGGHGVGLFEEGSGADVWVEYVHGKDEVEDMPSTAGASSYEGQYNGIVMGVDFKKVNKFQSGIAFNYGEGDTNSVGNAVRTHSDYDFWGVGYYGSIHNDDSNVIFDISYAQTDSDVTQNNSGTAFEANPETTTWSAGVKLEKLYQNENVQIVPYTGLRYMSIDSDDYATKDGAFMYSMDRQDIWLLPLGVSIRQEIANDNGWTVSPRVDLSYIWAFGDTNSNMEVKSPFAGVSQLGYDVMDDGSFLGLVGIEAHKGQWGYGVAYSYQKGDHSESKKWYVDVNYSF